MWCVVYAILDSVFFNPGCTSEKRPTLGAYYLNKSKQMAHL